MQNVIKYKSDDFPSRFPGIKQRMGFLRRLNRRTCQDECENYNRNHTVEDGWRLTLTGVKAN